MEKTQTTPTEAARIVREALVEARRIYIQEKFSTANAKNDQAFAALDTLERCAEDNSELTVAYMLGAEHGKDVMKKKKKKIVRKPRGGSEKMAAMFLPDHADIMVGTCPKCGFNPQNGREKDYGKDANHT